MDFSVSAGKRERCRSSEHCIGIQGSDDGGRSVNVLLLHHNNTRQPKAEKYHPVLAGAGWHDLDLRPMQLIRRHAECGGPVGVNLSSNGRLHAAIVAGRTLRVLLRSR